MTTATRKENTVHIEKCSNTLVLPWPDSRLSPNSRKPHRWLTDVRAIARNTGFFAAKEDQVQRAEKHIEQEYWRENQRMIKPNFFREIEHGEK